MKSFARHVNVVLVSFTYIDLCLGVILIWSAIAGLRAGLARVVVGLAATLAGILFGFWCYRLVGVKILPWVKTEALADVLGFLLIFCGALIVGSILAAILSRLFRWIGLSWFDHLLGGLAGVVRGAIVIAASLDFVIAFAPSPIPQAVQQSRILPYATTVSSWLIELAPRELRDAFTQQLENLRQLWKQPAPRHGQQV